jgi:glycerol-3-phosphate acyltransferase PlsX
MLGINKPRIGLLSVGEEEIKGNPLVKETQKLFRESKLNFIGNVEGHQILEDVCDVLVCDGFTGNALLKFGESLVALASDSLKEMMRGSLRAKLGGMLLYPGVRQFFSKVSYSQYGGAILLGTRGVTVVCHGRSTSRAIKSAIIMASKYVREGINKRIEGRLSRNEVS